MNATAADKLVTWMADFLAEGVERFGSVEAFEAALVAYNAERAGR